LGVSRARLAAASLSAASQVAAAVGVIAKARRVFVLGQRSCYPVAFHFAYVFGLAGGRTRLLDAPGGTGSDALRDAQKGDALLAISVKPYTRTTVEVTRHAARRGVSVVAITDSAVSPLARAARATILVPTESPSFFHPLSLSADLQFQLIGLQF
jgi:DNA-binding MurR/RpiR family transcriptional regulator